MDGWVGELEYRREEWIYMDIPDGWVVEWLDGWMDGWTNLSSLFLQNYFKKRGISIVFFLRKTRPCGVTRRYSISSDE